MNVLVLHDMIPELFGWDLSMPEWVGKRMAIDAYVVLHALWSCQAMVLTSWGLFRRADAVVFVGGNRNCEGGQSHKNKGMGGGWVAAPLTSPA